MRCRCFPFVEARRSIEQAPRGPAQQGTKPGGVAMKTNETYGTQIAEALANCAPLAESSEERDELWLVVQSLVCTKAQRTVVPLGSKAPVVITADYACQELLAAMEW